MPQYSCICSKCAGRISFQIGGRNTRIYTLENTHSGACLSVRVCVCVHMSHSGRVNVWKSAFSRTHMLSNAVQIRFSTKSRLLLEPFDYAHSGAAECGGARVVVFMVQYLTCKHAENIHWNTHAHTHIHEQTHKEDVRPIARTYICNASSSAIYRWKLCGRSECKCLARQDAHDSGFWFEAHTRVYFKPARNSSRTFGSGVVAATSHTARLSVVRWLCAYIDDHTV